MDTPMKKQFGIMPDGTVVEQYTLLNGSLECDIITYGGALCALRLPDCNGNITDVLLGFDTLEAYREQDKYMGALIGRYANRIGGAGFVLNGKAYPLAANDGVNHLHGGPVGFDKLVWTVEKAEKNVLVLSLISPDGQEGYPGTLQVQVTYTLEADGIVIDYSAVCDQDTICNLTNHAYFNLSGHASGEILDQEMQIFADCYTPTDAGSIPTGELAAVEGSPMDLRKAIRIGDGLAVEHPQLELAGGYDHNWVIADDAELKKAAEAYSPATGIVMEVLTTEPGIQFYSGNYLDHCPAGKDGAPYEKRWGFCLETQHYPDTPNQAHFPATVLPAGEIYRQKTIYRFGIR